MERGRGWLGEKSVEENRTLMRILYTDDEDDDDNDVDVVDDDSPYQKNVFFFQTKKTTNKNKPTNHIEHTYRGD